MLPRKHCSVCLSLIVLADERSKDTFKAKINPTLKQVCLDSYSTFDLDLWRSCKCNSRQTESVGSVENLYFCDKNWSGCCKTKVVKSHYLHVVIEKKSVDRGRN